MREQTQVLEARELVPNRRRAPFDPGRERLLSDGYTGLEVVLDDHPQYELLPI